LLELRPAVDLALEEARRLHDLELAGVVEVAELRVPTPAAAREAERLAPVDERRAPVLHLAETARAQPRKVALLERELRRDVRDEHVEAAVRVQVGEVDAHALERVVAEHLRR